MRILLVLFFGAVLARPGQAQTTYQYCTPRSEPVAPQPIAWPDAPGVEPIWELEFLPPSSSTGLSGSGLEIRNVTYNGRSVLKQGHVPILNVKYEETGCDCFRDWSYEDRNFVADNAVGSCHAEATPGTVRTMCDAAPANCEENANGDIICEDVGDFSGVAVERYADRLVLTTQYRAGWYRYTMRWTFFEDGTVHPRFGFTSTGSSCTQNPRRHHAYWRFDFDIEGADHDYVVERRQGVVSETFATETRRTWGEVEDGITWSVLDLETERGFTVAPSAEDYRTPTNPGTGIPAIDDFAREDAVVARYRMGEIDDGIRFANVTPSCDAEFEGEGNATVAIVNGEEAYDTDVVLWYRSGLTKADIDPSTCYVVGPVLTPVGDWSTRPVAAEDGAAPTGFALSDPYPNPFDGTTNVRFTVERAQLVALVLYDTVGRAVRTVYAGTPPAGLEQTATISGSDLPNGVYTLRLEGDGISASKRVVLLK